jgi:hypothetical protein
MRILSPNDKIADKSTILWATEADFLNVGNYLTKYMVLNSVIFMNSSDVEGVYYLFYEAF